MTIRADNRMDGSITTAIHARMRAIYLVNVPDGVLDPEPPGPIAVTTA